MIFIQVAQSTANEFNDVFLDTLEVTILSGGLAISIATVAFIYTVVSDHYKASKRERDKSKAQLEYFQDRDTISFLKYSLTQIEEYYIINKSQARNTYWAAILVSLLGFIIILLVIAGWTANVNDLQIVVPLSGIVASILLEFIAFSLLNIYRATLQQLNSYFVQLVRIQELLLSIDLLAS